MVAGVTRTLHVAGAQVAVKAKNVNLYNDFYTSDLLLASPLGLRRIIGGVGDKERDYDFLSSVEVIVVDQVRLGMQVS
jgi:U3 small nucleolar RNA-associated protein 25